MSVQHRQVRQIEASTYEKIQPSTQAVTAATPFFCRRARRDTKMTRRSGRSSEGRKRTKAAKETVLAWMERWTSLVKVNETKVNEKQKGTSVANIFTNTTLIKKYRLEDVEHGKGKRLQGEEKRKRESRSRSRIWGKQKKVEERDPSP